LLIFLISSLELESYPQFKLIPDGYANADCIRFYLHWLAINRGGLCWYSQFLGVAQEALRKVWKFISYKV
jgi:hypothetical protein